jgi:hypothetical protein
VRVPMSRPMLPTSRHTRDYSEHASNSGLEKTARLGPLVNLRSDHDCSNRKK